MGVGLMPYKDPEKRRANGRAASKRYRERYPDRAKAATKRWEDANPEKQKAKSERRLASDPDYSRRHWYMSQYGLTIEQRDMILAINDGACAICKERPAEHIDHDGVTGDLRGGLCGSCNRGLGMYRDDPAFLRAAADYLERERDWSFLDEQDERKAA